MHRLRIFLAIAVATFLALHALERGHFRSTVRALATIAPADWQPAAEREVTARPEDAFQRAWNSSENRVDRALEKGDNPK